jgi:glycosyltransferase involved in cell wall biosynthesis
MKSLLRLAKHIYMKFRHRLPYPVRRRVSKAYHSLRSQNITSSISKDDLASAISTSMKLRLIFAEAKVIVIQPTFMNLEGDRYMFGGAERYLLELNKICDSMGLRMVVVQLGDPRSKAGFWVHNYSGMNVVGISEENSENLIMKIQQFLTDETLVIFSPFTLAINSKKRFRNLGISHGVFWDSPNYYMDKNHLKAALHRLDTLISVDTNTINSMRSVGLGDDLAGKYKILKNFYEAQPTPTDGFEQPRSINILYPRRLYEARGFYLICEILHKLLSLNSDITFTFLGSGEEQDINVAKKFVSAYPGRIFHFTENPQDVWVHYNNADIVLIPTMYSEGTSLSAIEALSCGKIVIASDIGGLTDLIIDGFNGYLCQPDPTSFLRAIEVAVSNLDSLDYMRVNAKNSVVTLELSKWKNEWEKIFQKYFHSRTIEEPGKSLIYFGSTEWNDLPQRAQGLLSRVSGDREVFYVNNSVHHGEDSLDMQTNSEGVKILTITMPEGPWNAGFAATKEICIGIARNISSTINKGTVIMCGHPSWVFATESFDNLKIYDRFDDWQAFSVPKEWTPSQILAFSKIYEDDALKIVDGLTFTSKKLSVEGIPSLFLPNGFDVEKANMAHQTFADTVSKNKKVGFFGALADWVDVDLIKVLADANPEIEFEIIGAVSADVSSLQKLGNVHFYPVMNQIALYVKAAEWRVGLIPFKINSLTESADPIKAYEYTALNIPILASRLPSLEEFPQERIRIYDTHSEALRYLQELIEESHILNSANLNKWVNQQTWSKRIEDLFGFIEFLDKSEG